MEIPKRVKDLSGKTFENLRVVELIGRNNRGEPLWLCVCSCGNKTTVKTYNLTSGHTKSCGCLKTGIKRYDYSGQIFGNIKIVKHIQSTKHRDQIYEYMCKCGYIGQIYGNNIGKTLSCSGCGYKRRKTGYEEIDGWYLTSLKGGAKGRQIRFDLTIEYLWKLYIKQNRKCAYTGRSIEFCRVKDRKKQTASLDRIDPNKAYIEGNVHWVHREINFFKNKYSHKDFINLCKEVGNYEFK